MTIFKELKDIFIVNNIAIPFAMCWGIISILASVGPNRKNKFVEASGLLRCHSLTTGK
jgi:hypothetical protein